MTKNCSNGLALKLGFTNRTLAFVWQILWLPLLLIKSKITFLFFFIISRDGLMDDGFTNHHEPSMRRFDDFQPLAESGFERVSVR